MKRTLLSIVAIAALCFTTNAQSIVFQDDFEAYTVGGYLGSQSSDWTTWSNMPGTTEDALISDEQASSGTKSVKLESPSGTNGPTDLVLPLGDVTTGNYLVTMNMYVVAGNGAYFNIQHFETPGVQWAIEVYFDNLGAGTLEANGLTVPFTYTPASWVQVAVSVDLDNMLGALIVGTTLVGTWPWNTQADGTPGANQLGGINIYAAAPTGQDALYYVDDVMLTQLSGVGVEELLSADQVTLGPVPATDVLTITGPISQQSQVRILDMTGKVLSIPMVRTSNTTINASVASMVPGVYFMEITDANAQVIKRFIKE